MGEINGRLSSTRCLYKYCMYTGPVNGHSVTNIFARKYTVEYISHPMGLRIPPIDPLFQILIVSIIVTYSFPLGYHLSQL